MTSIRARISWLAVAEAVELAAASASGNTVLDVVDLGGGTGTDAVRVAERGHRVTVVDSSPDALAALGRRAAESGVELTGVLGDGEDVAAVLEPGSADLVLCHGVLDHVESPALVLEAMASVVRPHGVLSVVVPGRIAAIQARMAAADVAGARLFVEADPAEWDLKAWGPRRYLWHEIEDLVGASSWTPVGTRGVRVFADHAGSGGAVGEPDAVEEIVRIEQLVRAEPRFASGSVGLQVLGRLD